jgi:diacylglycerol kinase family enzyme
LPNDPIEATSVVLQKLREGQERVVNLGVANGRYFGVNAGFGFDAETVRYVEKRHLLKKTVRQASFVYCGVLAYFGAYRRRKARITLTVPGEEPVEGLRTAVCCNSNPFTFLGPFRAQLCPSANIDAGLDVAALTRWGPARLVRVALTALRGPHVGRLRSMRHWHDLEAVELRANTPLALQVDGDFVEETDRVALRLVPRALTVIA